MGNRNAPQEEDPHRRRSHPRDRRRLGVRLLEHDRLRQRLRDHVRGASNLAIAQTSTIANMYPGDSAQTISGTVTNSASNSAYVNSVTVSIASVTQASGAGGTCDASDYTLASPTMSVAADVAAGGSANFTGATIKFNNKASNQDGCNGATVNLSYASN
jgi:hypothetical protein